MGPVDLAKIAEISKCRFERATAEEWALMGIEFLVFDDTDDIEGNDLDNNDEDGMLEYALRMSYGSNENLSSCEAGSSDDTTRTNPFRSSPKDADKMETLSCRVCATYPECPHRRKSRKFRIVQPTRDHPEWFHNGEAKFGDVCKHYVAVSYSWPPPEAGQALRTYQVRDPDGTTRSNRALDDVLDRAVDFANSHGLCMIWIDQECLPQPDQTGSTSKADLDEQEVGIQSMDIVYNRAMVTAGLLDVEITSQEQLTAIHALLYYDQNEIQKMISPRFCDYILDFLHRTCQDRCYTRAWVVQKSLFVVGQQ